MVRSALQSIRNHDAPEKWSKVTKKAEQNGCRQRLVWHLSCHWCLPPATLLAALRAGPTRRRLIRDARQLTSVMPDWLKIFIPSILGLATTIGAAFLSARWATRKAFQERWWERKEKAYAEIVEALHDLIRYSSICAKESLSGNERDYPKKKEFEERYSEAYWKIQRATDIGAFVISEQAAAILAELRQKPKLDWNENPPWDIYEDDCDHFRKALARIRQCAIQDLKV